MSNRGLKKGLLGSAAAFMFGASGMATSASGLIEEILVTAQKREQSLLEVPISVSVTTGAELERRAVSDSSEFFKLEPSLIWNDSSSTTQTSVGIRGVSSLAIEGGLQPSIIMIVDDVPLARNGEFVIDLIDIDRIEVLRGPQGTLIGKNATGGAINIVTKRPEDEFSASASVQVTDEIEQLYKAYVTGPITDFARFRLNGFYKDHDDYIDNINSAGIGPDEIGGYESKGVRGMLEIDLTDSLTALLSGDWREYKGRTGQHTVIVPRTGNTAADISDLGYIPEFGRDVVNIDVEPLTMDETWGVALDVAWELNAHFDLKWVSGYREYENDSEVDVDSTSFGRSAPPGGALILQSFPRKDIFSGRGEPRDQHEYFTTEARLVAQYDRFSGVAGIFYTDLDQTRLGLTPFERRPAGVVRATSASDGSLENRTWAIFGDATVDITDRLGIFGGLRYTDETVDFELVSGRLQVPTIDLPDGTTDRPATLPSVIAEFDRCRIGLCPLSASASGKLKEDDVTGRVGLTFELAPEKTVYASYSTGYKGPGVNLGRLGAGSASVTVDPETAKNYEIGFKGRFLEDRLQVTAAIFYQEIDNLQATQIIPGTVSSELLNAGKVESQGLEIDFIAKPTEALTITGGMAYVDAELQGLINPCYPGQVWATGCRAGGDTATEDSSSPTGFLQAAQDLSGNQPPMAPEFKFSVEADYNWVLDTLPFDAFWWVGFVWMDDFTTRLGNDPLVVIEGHGRLDLTIGITGDDDRYEIAIFGKNVTDEFTYAQIIENNGLLGRANGYINPDASAAFGIRGRVSF